jgi:glycosyltransferase involved in cell wall biosynthesis
MHTITGLSTGGAEMMLYKLLRSMDRERFSPVVVSLVDIGAIGARIDALGVPVHALGMSPGSVSPRALRALVRLIASCRPAIVQGWMYHSNLAASLATPLARVGAPVLWNIRASLDGFEREKRTTAAVIRLGALVSPATAGIVYNSHSSARQHEAIGYRASRTEVIPNGFDCGEFRPDPAGRSELRAAERIDADAILVGCIGRDHPVKDHGTFLAAAAIAHRADARLRFLLAGAGMDTANAVLGRTIRDHGLAGHVHLLGERGDMPRVTAALDIACSSSAWGEGFPNVLGEALACGVPCVATDVGDSARIVGDCGSVVPVRSPEALARGILSLARLEPAQRQALGARGRGRVSQDYSLEAVARRYEHYYQHFLDRLA